MKRILLVDNYDSFTYNLAHYLEALDCEVTTQFNDCINLDTVSQFDGIVLSPGPGLPSEAGLMPQIIARYIGEIPMLGVCLGMQGMALYLGGEIYNQKTVKHGVKETIQLEDSEFFKGIGTEMEVGLYHSWAVTDDGSYKVVARSLSGVIMAIENAEMKCFGVQFHPESIMTPMGKALLGNFLVEGNLDRY